MAVERGMKIERPVYNLQCVRRLETQFARRALAACLAFALLCALICLEALGFGLSTGAWADEAEGQADSAIEDIPADGARDLPDNALSYEDPDTKIVYLAEPNLDEDGDEDGTATLRFIALAGIDETRARILSIPETLPGAEGAYTVTSIAFDAAWAPFASAGSDDARVRDVAPNIFGERVQAARSGDVGAAEVAMTPSARLTSLETLVVPASVTRIGAHAFRGMTGLTSVHFAPGSQLAVVEESAFKFCTALTDIALPDSIVRLGAPAGDKGAAAGVFNGCSALEQVHVPKPLTTLSAGTFAGCSSLRTVDFAEGALLSRIEPDAFSDCVALESVTIPASVVSLSGFGFCTSLADIDLRSATKLKEVGSRAFIGLVQLSSFTVPHGVVRIGARAFESSGVVAVDLPDTLAAIGTLAFRNSKLAALELPASLARTGPGIVAGTPLSRIEAHCNQAARGFMQGSHIVRARLHPSDGTFTFADAAFGSCSKLKTVVCKGDAASLSLQGDAFMNTPALQTIAFTGNVAAIDVVGADPPASLLENQSVTVYGWDEPAVKARVPAPLPAWCAANGIAYEQLRDVSNVTAAVQYEERCTYDGGAHTASVSVKDGNVDLVEGVDFEVVYSTSTVEAGVVRGAIYGLGAYAAFESDPFECLIEPRDISSGLVSTVDGKDIAEFSSSFTGSPIEPSVKVTAGPDKRELLRQRDYTRSFRRNVDAGEAAVEIVGQGNYTGRLVAAFTISPADIAMARAKPVTPRVYTGKPIEPELSVTLPPLGDDAGSRTLIDGPLASAAAMESSAGAGVQAKSAVKSDAGAGAASDALGVAEEGLAPAGEAPGASEAEAVVASDAAFSARVENAGASLAWGVDCTADFAANVDPGEARAVIRGVGNYRGTATEPVNFTIRERPLSSARLVPLVPSHAPASSLVPAFVVAVPDQDASNGRLVPLAVGRDYRARYVDAQGASTNAALAEAVVIEGVGPGCTGRLLVPCPLIAFASERGAILTLGDVGGAIAELSDLSDGRRVR